MTMFLKIVCVVIILLINPSQELSEEMQELVDMLHSTCVGETEAKEDEIVDARKGIFADNQNFKCYIKCLMSQMACIEDDGTIDEEATISVLPEEYKDKAAPIIKKCGTKRGADACETAWLTHKCYQSEAPEVNNGLFSGLRPIKFNG